MFRILALLTVFQFAVIILCAIAIMSYNLKLRYMYEKDDWKGRYR